jgi:hypothetical protein
VSERLVHLAVRLRDELAELEYVADRVAKAWEHALSVGDDYLIVWRSTCMASKAGWSVLLTGVPP